MRISDWSSDVCSSDLIGPLIRDPLRILLRRELFPVARLKRNVAMTADIIEMPGKDLRALLPPRNLDQHLRASAHDARKRARHSGGYGETVTVRVHLGGRRSTNKPQDQHEDQCIATMSGTD